MYNIIFCQYFGVSKHNCDTKYLSYPSQERRKNKYFEYTLNNAFQKAFLIARRPPIEQVFPPKEEGFSTKVDREGWGFCSTGPSVASDDIFNCPFIFCWNTGALLWQG